MKSSTLLYRQIHPTFVQGDNVSSQAFRPTPKDNNRLSVYDGDLISAEKSHLHFTKDLNCESIGVLGVSVAECQIENLHVSNDSQTFKEHALIDFTEYGHTSKGTIKRKAESLRKYAMDRGWCFLTIKYKSE